MAKQNTHAKLQQRLAGMLAKQFPGITVEVGRSERWKRTALTFCWAGFDDLLPEERFHRLFHSIGEEFYEEHLRGCVWFELGSSESVDDFLKLPRSEDIHDREASVIEQLNQAGFFSTLAEELGAEPTATCGGDFSGVRRVLTTKDLSADILRDALLVLMRNGAFCDCEALFNAQLVQLRTSTS
ncbi:MAG: DUF2695 domain-containing protein [bacterium]|nr:DUF2695 domain-containing protein [bacterium]